MQTNTEQTTNTQEENLKDYEVAHKNFLEMFEGKYFAEVGKTEVFGKGNVFVVETSRPNGVKSVRMNKKEMTAFRKNAVNKVKNCNKALKKALTQFENQVDSLSPVMLNSIIAYHLEKAFQRKRLPEEMEHFKTLFGKVKNMDMSMFLKVFTKESVKALYDMFPEDESLKFLVNKEITSAVLEECNIRHLNKFVWEAACIQHIRTHLDTVSPQTVGPQFLKHMDKILNPKKDKNNFRPPVFKALLRSYGGYRSIYNFSEKFEASIKKIKNARLSIERAESQGRDKTVYYIDTSSKGSRYEVHARDGKYRVNLSSTDYMQLDEFYSSEIFTSAGNTIPIPRMPNRALNHSGDIIMYDHRSLLWTIVPRQLKTLVEKARSNSLEDKKLFHGNTLRPNTPAYEASVGRPQSVPTIYNFSVKDDSINEYHAIALLLNGIFPSKDNIPHNAKTEECPQMWSLEEGFITKFLQRMCPNDTGKFMNKSYEKIERLAREKYEKKEIFVIPEKKKGDVFIPPKIDFSDPIPNSSGAYPEYILRTIRCT